MELVWPKVNVCLHKNSNFLSKTLFVAKDLDFSNLYTLFHKEVFCWFKNIKIKINTESTILYLNRYSTFVFPGCKDESGPEHHSVQDTDRISGIVSSFFFFNCWVFTEPKIMSCSFTTQIKNIIVTFSDGVE